MRCSYCGSRGHTIANCPKTAGGSSRHRAMRCTYCGGRDHKAPACPKTWGGSAARAFAPETVADHFVLDRGRR